MTPQQADAVFKAAFYTELLVPRGYKRVLVVPGVEAETVVAAGVCAATIFDASTPHRSVDDDAQRIEEVARWLARYAELCAIDAEKYMPPGANKIDAARPLVMFCTPPRMIEWNEATGTVVAWQMRVAIGNEAARV